MQNSSKISLGAQQARNNFAKMSYLKSSVLFLTPEKKITSYFLNALIYFELSPLDRSHLGVNFELILVEIKA